MRAPTRDGEPGGDGSSPGIRSGIWWVGPARLRRRGDRRGAGPVQRPAVRGRGAGHRRRGGGRRVPGRVGPAAGRRGRARAGGNGRGWWRPARRACRVDGSGRIRGVTRRHARSASWSGDRGPGRAGRRRQRSAASGTCAGTRRTGWPPWPPRSTPSAETSPSWPTGSRSAPRHCTAGCSTPTTITGSPSPPPCSGWPSRVCASSNAATTGKTLPDFVDRWLGMLGSRGEPGPRPRPGRGRRPGPSRAGRPGRGPRRGPRTRRRSRLGRDRRPRSVRLPGRRPRQT